MGLYFGVTDSKSGLSPLPFSCWWRELYIHPNTGRSFRCLYMIQVTIEKPDLGGRGSVRSITFNGTDVKDDISLSSAPAHIRRKEDLEIVRIPLSMTVGSVEFVVSSVPAYFLR